MFYRGWAVGGGLGSVDNNLDNEIRYFHHCRCVLIREC